MEKSDWFLAVKKNNLGLGLKAIDLLILSQIEEFQIKGHECYMTNEQFSNLFGESVSTIKRSLDKLEELNVIKRKNSFVQGNGKSTKQRVLILNDKPKWKVHNEPTKLNEAENGRFKMNLPNEMEGSKVDDGRFKNDKWKVHIEPIKNNLKNNLKSNLENGHPSDTLERPTDVEHPSDAAPPKAVLEPEKKKDKQKKEIQSKEENLNTLSDTDLEEIKYLFSVEHMKYNEICKKKNLPINSLTQDIILFEIDKILEKRKIERKIEKDRKDILSSIDKDSSVLNRLSEYFRSTPEEVRDNLIQYGMKPDVLLGCFDNNELYRYERWEKESKKTYPTHFDWVWTLYESNVINADDVNTGNSVISGGFSSYIEMENSSLDDKDINDMTDDEITAWIDSW